MYRFDLESNAASGPDVEAPLDVESNSIGLIGTAAEVESAWTRKRMRTAP